MSKSMLTDARLNKILRGVFLLGVFVLALSRIESFDTFWQLQSGQYIWETGQFIYQDIFSLAPDAMRIEHCWLSDLIFFATYTVGGYGLLTLLKPVTIVLCSWLLMRWNAIREVDTAFALPVILLCLLASQPSWLVRPQLWTFIFSLLYLFLLHRGRDNNGKSWVWLPVIMIFWANLHAACVFGFALIAFFGLGEIFRVRLGQTNWQAIRKLLLIGLLTVGTAFLNPYGYRIPMSFLGNINLHNVSLSTMSGNMEWLPPTFEQVPLFYVVMLLWGLLILCRLRRIDPAEPVFFLAFLYMGLSMIRHTTLVGLMAGFFLPGAVQEMYAFFVKKLKPPKMIFPVLRYGAIIVLFFLVLIRGVNGQIGVGLKTSDYPIAATDFLVENKLPANLYNAYDWGGYLMWRLYPDYLVFVDGRSDSIEMFKDSSKIENSWEGWSQALEKHEVNTIITRTCFSDTGGPQKLIDALAVNPEWVLVFSDEVALIYLRRGEETKSLIERYKRPNLDAYATMWAEASRLYREDKSRTRSLLAMGRSATKLGRYDDGLVAYQKFLKAFPDNREAQAAVNLLSRWTQP